MAILDFRDSLSQKDGINIRKFTNELNFLKRKYGKKIDNLFLITFVLSGHLNADLSKMRDTIAKKSSNISIIQQFNDVISQSDNITNFLGGLSYDYNEFFNKL